MSSLIKANPALSTADVSAIARAALTEMASAQIPATPENYATHFARHAIARGIVQNEFPAGAARDAQEKQAERSIQGILAIVESFLSNITETLGDNPALKEQIELVRHALTDPSDLARLKEARRSLQKLRAPQLAGHLAAAKLMAKQMADAFLSQMNVAGEATGAFETALSEKADRIRDAKTPEQAMDCVSEMIEEATKAQSALGSARSRMDETRQKAEEAEGAIRDLEAQLLKASEAAKHDYLTGLLNRRGLDELLEAHFASNLSPCLALLDIDNFKQLNDSLGHEAGDEALKGLANTISEALGEQAIPARMGGEEFLLIFPTFNLDETKAAIEQLQRFLTKKHFMQTDGARVITFSAGCARRTPGETAASCIARADEAMYAAKRAGKNRVHLST